MATAPVSVTTIKLAPMSDGCCLRIEGRGTMHESPCAEAIASRTLEADQTSRVVFDLSACDYLDSTFLGCLIHLFRDFGKGTPPRFQVAAPPAKRKKLLGACNLESMIPSIDTAPDSGNHWVTVPPSPLGTKEMTKHVWECHKLLAEVDSPMRPAFAKIAEQLERELTAMR